MRKAPSNFPDRLLRHTQSLPWPASSGTFNVLRRIYEARGKSTGQLTRIQFGSVEITAPLAHPAVYWRYRPVGFNQNYLLLVKRILEARRGLIIDVGANIGDGVALLRGAEKSTRRPLAIEGADIWFDLLGRTRRIFPRSKSSRCFSALKRKITIKRYMCRTVPPSSSKELLKLR